MLILASQSPRRRELLRAAGIAFRVVVPDVEESWGAAPRGRYADLARRAALAKASEVAGRERGMVLGADTIVVCEGEILGKPADEGDARRMLRKLSGRRHRVYTGVALVDGSRRVVGYERTEVAFRALSKKQIDWYVSTGEPMDKAGSYAIQGTGAALVRAVRGCYTNVIGLPLPKVLDLLAEFERQTGACRPRGGGRR
jgi:septum formation protein